MIETFQNLSERFTEIGVGLLAVSLALYLKGRERRETAGPPEEETIKKEGESVGCGNQLHADGGSRRPGGFTRSGRIRRRRAGVRVRRNGTKKRKK